MYTQTHIHAHIIIEDKKILIKTNKCFLYQSFSSINMMMIKIMKNFDE